MTCYGWAPWNVEKVGYLLKVAISVDILCESLICLFYTWFCCTSNVCWNSYIGCLKTVFFTSVIMCKAARCRINGFPQWFQFRDRVWTHAGAIGWVSMGLDGCKVRPYEYVPSGHFFYHGQIHTFNGIEILQARSNHWRLWKKRMLHPLRNKQCVLCAIASRNIKKQLKQIDLHDLPVFSAMHFCYFLYVAFQGRSPAPFDAFCETLRCVSPGETLR